MAMIQCHECNRLISKSAKACPVCGAPKKDIGCLTALLIIGVFLFGFFLLAGSCGGSSSLKLGQKDKQQKEFSAFDSLVKRGLAFHSGSYAKGSIPSGQYVFISKTGGYYSETANGEILDNENFSSFGYVYVHGLGDIKTRGLLVKLKGLKELGYSGAKDAYENLTKQTNYQASGHYLVGTDIRAGSHILKSNGSGYVEVNRGPVGQSNIITNDNFNGTKTILVNVGEYVKLSRAMMQNR